jgi:hypothetical protein
MRRFWAIAAIAAALASGWALAQDEDEAHPTLMAPGGFMLFYGGAGPVSYRESTPRDVPKQAKLLGEVQGEGCQQGLFIPIQLSFRSNSVSGITGNAGFEKALREIHQQHPALDGLFDVKVDRHTLSILGIYRRECTEVVAQGFSSRS